MNESTLTCVSGYWEIKNKHGDKFNNWFHNTLQINCPYVFFGDKETIEMIKKYRGDLPTHYIFGNECKRSAVDYAIIVIRAQLRLLRVCIG
jgi:hypothetical protein